MENRKLIIYGSIVFLLFLVGYLYYVLFLIKKPTVPVIPLVTPFPVFRISPTVTLNYNSEKMTTSGVTVDNFYKNAQEVMPNNDAIISDNSDFQIVYYARGDYFLISINNSPFEETMTKSEKELLKILNIGQEDACKLKLRIITPYNVNPDFAYKDYPLSFCK